VVLPAAGLYVDAETLRAIESDLAARGLVGQLSYEAWRRAAIERAALRSWAAARRRTHNAAIIP
jgi:hypothetical protein